MVDEELHFKTVLRRKNAAKARIYRKSVIDDKKSKRLKTALKENGTFDKRRDNDSTALRIPLSELSPNILNDGRGIANVEELQFSNKCYATNSSFDEDEMSNGTDAMETFEITSGGYYDIGDPVIECQYYGANMWYSERKNKCRQASNPKFSMCCGSGKVQLPLLKSAPKVLQHLLFDNESCESKNFQQQIRMYNFQLETIVDQDGFPVYRRRDNGHTVLKNGIQVDNRNVVPYNAKLLTKYQAHINMEWCNQSTSIKYLFKYINKGYDRITAAIVPNDDGTSNQPQNIDEIKQYIDCRYVSPSEASWRIFSFPIHGRKPAVERLYFHCEGQNSVYYTDFDRINTVLEKPSVTESMFTSWFEANCKYPEAQNLTYSKFVSKFVYVKKKREWKPRQKGYTIGRLIWVPPTTGELYYLRLMLTHVKGPRSYNDIKTVNNVKYDTFRDACFAMGFIGDDRELIAAIKEANHWGSGQYLRLLFVHMLLSGSINRPRHVWSKTCHLLADGMLYAQQRIANNRGIIFPIL
ncbi:hypothetical protein KIW84_062559 [Lathyrus oleraceus]|uniref:Helitron helicase-like domain-containing protein n=1 Tax=Pisum sativum TaxID=3888 RepID=A0A9D4W7W7_PEA|nr:hypothetical protein KIW84_062559 [Pisum sativum]